MAQYEPSHLELYCLQKCLSGSAKMKALTSILTTFFSRILRKDLFPKVPVTAAIEDILKYCLSFYCFSEKILLDISDSLEEKKSGIIFSER